MRWRYLLLVCCLSTGTHAEIYRYTNAQGEVIYTHQPPAGVEATPIELSTPNRLEPPSRPLVQPPSSSVTSGKAAFAYQIRWIGLTSGQTIRANDGNLHISVQLQPELQSGHFLRFSLDGQAVTGLQADAEVYLTELDRGAHSIMLEVLEANGKVIQTSAPLSFTLQRSSLNNPARR
ncbi:uncharacterized protein DUF4124 [Azomonas agilis]|uniref:Uncharacterized protein DUF4124 n=1 Tax=Azomonas agilis TaxID=116849 RepID=A0A562J2X3_9GAMM|nr:DUF4124 domain-containing protein [Azomonas agilis]TWH77497.1 uncharacterized protein DUF4124 [Azomonas agilis]